MITALIRTHPGREASTERAIASAKAAGCEVLIHYGERTPGFEYNLYCNILKAQVYEGYFFFLDSDDVLMPGVLRMISPLLQEDKANVIQMYRKGRPKPKNEALIRLGSIGLPCLILHSRWKELADVGDQEYSDGEWIQAVRGKLPTNFIPIPLVNSIRRNYGK